jgi:hypothetical protein
MTEVNGTWMELPATNTTGTRTGLGGLGRRARLTLRLDEAIEEMDAHFHRCPTCLAQGRALCYEGTYARDEIELARARLHRFELRHAPTASAIPRPRPFALRPEAI